MIQFKDVVRSHFCWKSWNSPTESIEDQALLVQMQPPALLMFAGDQSKCSLRILFRTFASEQSLDVTRFLRVLISDMSRAIVTLSTFETDTVSSINR